MQKFPKVSVDPMFYLLLPASLLLLPAKLLLCWLVAAMIHELGHFIALQLFRIKVDSVLVGPFGASICVHQLSEGMELVCAGAGPLFGGALLLLRQRFPILAICAFVQTAYNLVPLPNHDGARILSAIFRLLSPGNAEAMSSALCWLVTVLAVGVCVYACYACRLGPGLLLVAGLVVLKALKIPCKPTKQIVQ